MPVVGKNLGEAVSLRTGSRTNSLPALMPPATAWTAELYREIREELQKFEL